VQRKLLTILFGQSGLGKTSILQAGLVPRLRPEGFCPVYVRIDYDPHSAAARRADQARRLPRHRGGRDLDAERLGRPPGRPLWEFLHHRDDVLKDANGRTLVPMLIFDQFEEIFTSRRAMTPAASGRQEFIEDLADLVENRPPAALEAKSKRTRPTLAGLTSPAPTTAC
jgi:hypothetical protein